MAESLNNLTVGSWALLEKPQIVQPVQKFPEFVEPEGSLQHLQELSTCPYSEQDQSSQ
jgi:hypothetical protein